MRAIANNFSLMFFIAKKFWSSIGAPSVGFLKMAASRIVINRKFVAPSYRKKISVKTLDY